MVKERNGLKGIKDLFISSKNLNSTRACKRYSSEYSSALSQLAFLAEFVFFAKESGGI